MYLSIIVLPLLGSIVSGFFGRKIGVTGSRILGCLIVITTTILAIIAFFEVGFNNNPVSMDLFKWLDSESFNISWNFQFDSLTVSMLIPVLIISSLVHFYSIGYMSHDPHSQRFFSYLSLFTFMMIVLVTGNNYLLMFVGWEGVGVCSYLLVSFWFTRIAANQSSVSAFLTNRVGDSFLTLGMIIILWSLGNLDYSTVFSLAPYINEDIITIIGICLLIGAMAKSSQVGLHIWLPMAMEGPTPVSALIHAATMVTAGVYLLIRSSPLIEYSSTVLLLCLWLGAVTTIFSSLVGLFQQDIKKIIAYSTMSQLGMMVIAIGLSSYNVALFHLVNHAFYKGLLFLGAGAVIHAVVDNQDLRKYGGFISFLPLTYTVILIASLSLVAFPFMTGFYSKDFILESAYGQYYFSSIDVYVIAVIGAIFTTLYSVKVIYLTFLTNPNGSVNYYKNAHESDIFISLPLVVLAIFSIYFGFITKDIFIGMGSGFFADNSIFIHPIHEILIDTEFGVPTLFKLIPFVFTVSFSALAIVYPEFMGEYISRFKLSNLGYYIFGFFNQRFLVEFFYNKFVINTVLDLGGQTTKVLDKGSVESIGPYGFGLVLVKSSKIISSLSNGIVTNYALYILIGICFNLSIFTFVSGASSLLDISNIVTTSSIFILLTISVYIYLNKYSETNIESGDSSLNLVSSLLPLYNIKKKTTLLVGLGFDLASSCSKIVIKLLRFVWIKVTLIITSPKTLVNLISFLIMLVFFGQYTDMTSFDGSDTEDSETSSSNSSKDVSNKEDKGKEIDTKQEDKGKEIDTKQENKGKEIDTKQDFSKHTKETRKPFTNARMADLFKGILEHDNEAWLRPYEGKASSSKWIVEDEEIETEERVRNHIVEARPGDHDELSKLLSGMDINDEAGPSSSQNKRVQEELAEKSDNEESNNPKDSANSKTEDSNLSKKRKY